MGKTFKRKSHRFDDDFDDDYGVDSKKKAVDQRKKRRIDRALKTGDIDTLLDEADDFVDLRP